jgi:hypothetical protein
MGAQRCGTGYKKTLLKSNAQNDLKFRLSIKN